jgi:hypothetical protein
MATASTTATTTTATTATTTTGGEFIKRTCYFYAFTKDGCRWGEKCNKVHPNFEDDENANFLYNAIKKPSGILFNNSDEIIKQFVEQSKQAISADYNPLVICMYATQGKCNHTKLYLINIDTEFGRMNIAACNQHTKGEIGLHLDFEVVDNKITAIIPVGRIPIIEDTTVPTVVVPTVVVPTVVVPTVVVPTVVATSPYASMSKDAIVQILMKLKDDHLILAERIKFMFEAVDKRIIGLESKLSG